MQEIEKDRQIITEGLNQFGYKITQAATVAGALASLEANTSKVDVVLAALHMEEASSFDLLREMKANDKLCGITFMFCCLQPSQFTKTTADGIRVAARALGAEEVIVQEVFDAKALNERITWALYKPNASN